MKKRTIFLILNLMVGMLVFGQARVPARHDPFALVQPNGDTIMARLVGDEVWHCHQTLDGQPIIQGKNGWWYYARESKCCTYTDRRGHKHPKLVKSCKKVQSAKCKVQSAECKVQSAKGEVQRVAPRRMAIEGMLSMQNGTMPGSANGIQRVATATNTIGQKDLIQKALVIMVQFSDWKFETGTNKAFVDSLFNGHQYNTIMTDQWLSYSSVAQYFNDQSNGQYRPQFNIVGPITLSKSYTAYPGSYYGSQLLTDALAQVKDSVDFSQYDLNNDGNVDMVFMYFAGYGQNDADYIVDPKVSDPKKLIWPHKGDYTGSLKYNGKGFFKYECCNELDGYCSFNPNYGTTNKRIHAGIGTLCHEFCHGMGLPDVYSTSGGDWRMGPFDIMDYGNYSGEGYMPANFTAYERWFFGWLIPTPINKAATLTLSELASSQQAYLLNETGIAPTEPNTTGIYYLLENRQAKGWDQSLWSTGMIVTRINYNANTWSRNSINTSTDWEKWSISPILTNGSHAVTESNYKSATWPGTSATSLNLVSNYTITGITQNADGTITFLVNGGTPTGVKEVQSAECIVPSAKVLRDGQIYIQRGDKTYDILGK